MKTKYPKFTAANQGKFEKKIEILSYSLKPNISYFKEGEPNLSFFYSLKSFTISEAINEAFLRVRHQSLLLILSKFM